MTAHASVHLAGTYTYADAAGDLDRELYRTKGRIAARLRADYGAPFLPGVGLMLPLTTIVPEIDLHVRF